MKPWMTLGAAAAPDGTPLVLQQRGEEFVVRAGGRVLMGSRQHASEDAMAAVALGGLHATAPRVLIGGLGLGFTLRAFLDLLPAQARVVVAELVAEVVAWNRGPVAHLARAPLEDPRVQVALGDVLEVARAAARPFDAIALDVDNGPAALTQRANSRLYGSAALQVWRDALKTGGRFLIWSPAPDPTYLDVLSRAGFNDVAMKTVPVHPGSSARHYLFYATTRPFGRKRRPER